MRRDEAGVGRERRVETAEGVAVTALGRDRRAEVVGDRGIARREGQGCPIRALGLGQPPGLKMSRRVGHERAKFGGCLLRQGVLLGRILIIPVCKNWKKF